MGRLRKAVQAIVNRSGYRIERIRPSLPGGHMAVGDYVLRLLNEQRGGHVRFVQIGANDGQFEDPCRAWILRHPWTGVLIEPQPHLAAKLRALYADDPRIRIEQVLISDQEGEVSFFSFTSGEMNGVATMHRETLEGYRSIVSGGITETRLPCVTLDTILERNGIEAIDYLQVDTEGHDYKILASIDLERLRPPLISYEHVNLSPEDNAACRRMLGALGYVFATSIGDTIAVGPSLRIISDDRRDYVLND